MHECVGDLSPTMSAFDTIFIYNAVGIERTDIFFFPKNLVEKFKRWHQIKLQIKVQTNLKT